MRKIINIIFKNKINKTKLISAQNIKKYFLRTGESLGEGWGVLGIHSPDYNECRLLFFPANCVTWLYSTLFFNTNDSDDECQVIHCVHFFDALFLQHPRCSSGHQTVAC